MLGAIILIILFYNTYVVLQEMLLEIVIRLENTSQVFQTSSTNATNQPANHLNKKDQNEPANILSQPTNIPKQPANHPNQLSGR